MPEPGSPVWLYDGRAERGFIKVAGFFWAKAKIIKSLHPES
jgi:hypothetical protein